MKEAEPGRDGELLPERHRRAREDAHDSAGLHRIGGGACLHAADDRVSARRILRLAAPSFLAVAKDVAGPVPVFIGLPELTVAQAPWMKDVPKYLQRLTGVPLDLDRSLLLPRSRG